MKFRIPPNTQRSNCSAAECRKTIFWIVTPGGKKMPVDPDGTSHFDTCVKASKFKPGARRPAAPGGADRAPVSSGAGQQTVREIFHEDMPGGVRVLGRTDGLFAVYDPRLPMARGTVSTHDSKDAAIEAAKRYAHGEGDG